MLSLTKIARLKEYAGGGAVRKKRKKKEKRRRKGREFKVISKFLQLVQNLKD